MKNGKNGLSDRELRFCQEYATTLNRADSIERSGYKCTRASAYTLGTRLLQKVEIQQHLGEILNLSTVTVLNEIVHIAFANITDVIVIDGNGVTVIPSSQWSNRAKAAVKSVKIKTRTTYDREGNPTVTTVTEVTMHDRLSALDKLMRKLGMYPSQSDVLSLVEAMAVNGLLVPGQADVIVEGVGNIRERLKDLSGNPWN